MKNSIAGTQGARVRGIRKSDRVNLTLAEFGKRLGVGGTTISVIETGGSNLTTQMKKAICREFGVNPNWLEAGEGEMFALPEPETFRELCASFSLEEQEILTELKDFDIADRTFLLEKLRFDMAFMRSHRK